jgi:hypothetical protein
MKKMISLVLMIAIYLLSLSVLPVQAWQQTDENNMSFNNLIKIKNMYPGPWKGWADGCENCYKPLASDRIERKRQGKKTGKKKIASTPPCSGYCECNCGKKNEVSKSKKVESTIIKSKKVEQSKPIAVSINSKQSNAGKAINTDVKGSGGGGDSAAKDMKKNITTTTSDDIPSKPADSSKQNISIERARNMDVRDSPHPATLLKEKTKEEIEKKEEKIEGTKKNNFEENDKKNMFDLFSFWNSKTESETLVR